MVHRWGALLLLTSLLKTALGCVCPPATALSRFPPDVPADACCLNFSGSAFGRVLWSVFTNGTNIEILDLSGCNITSVEAAGKEAGALRKVYLNGNQLTTLPREFLSRQAFLTEVDLSGNMLRELPEGFLRDSDGLQNLYLQENRLGFLPGSVLQKPALRILELDGNPWDCSCLFLESLEAGKRANRSVVLQDLVGNLTCVSPRNHAGREVWSLRLSEACRPAGLTALFIVLPLFILSILVLCWCCGRTRKKKEAPAFSSSKKRASNGLKQRTKQPTAAVDTCKLSACGGEIPKSELLLLPASKHLCSARDIYEEVEVKLGSVESLPRGSSRCSSFTGGPQGSQEPIGASKTELDTVSVTEVMKDSADREKAYMTQSTEYYSLVPAIELDDSDHGEYEVVDLS